MNRDTLVAELITEFLETENELDQVWIDILNDWGDTELRN